MANQIVVSAGAKVRNLQDVIIGTSGVLTSLGFDVANGIPRLDVNGKILVSQLPNSVMEYKGTWNAATNTPTLVNGTGNQGDVYLCNVAGTVNFGAGPIAFVVGDQVIYSGSIWQRASGATGTVTSVAVTESGDSLNITGSPITTSGTINIGFNGTNLQYVNGAGNLTTFPTLITSIGLSMPSAFSVANSPLTANGTIAVTGAGYASQYIRGDGTLADFPSSGGGGSSVSYYLNGGTSQGTIGGTTYYEMSKTAVIGTGVDFTKTGDGFIVAFLTDANDPAQLNIPAGNWNYEIYASMSSNGGTPQMYAELYVYDGTTFTLISTSTNEIIYDGTALNLYTFAMAVPATSLTLTDRLAIKLYATNSGGKTTTIHTQDSHLCQIITTFSTGITALNGLTAQVQYFQVGTSGTDFNISSTTATHTFNIPDASASARGLITTGTQTIAGSKTFSGLTEFTFSSGTRMDYGPYLIKGSVPIAFSGSTTNIYSDATTNNIVIRDNLSIAKLEFNNSTQTYTFPAATGTIALTSDLTGGTVTSVAMTVPTGLSVSGSPITTSGTLAVSLASGYSIPTTASQTNWDTAYTNRITSATAPLSIISNVIAMSEASGSVDGYLSRFDWTTFNNKQATITLTTTGTSGAATFTSNTLNIPNYGSALSGYLPLTGGTLTGPLGGTSASFSSSLTARTSVTGSGTNASPFYDDAINLGPTTNQSKIQFGNSFSSSDGTWLKFIVNSNAGANSPLDVLTLSYTGAATFSSEVVARGNIIMAYDTGGTNQAILSHNGTSAILYSSGNTTKKDFTIYRDGGVDAGLIIKGSTGNVLIGTSTDSGYKLDVNGTGRFTGQVTFGANSRGFIREPAGDVEIGGTAGAALKLYSNGVEYAKLAPSTGFTTTLPFGGTSATFSSSVSGTSIRSSAVGTFGFNTANNGEFQIYATALDGMIMAGRGSTNDMVITNKNGNDVLRIPTGTTGVTLVGALTGTSATFSSSVTATGFFESSDSRLKTLIQDNYQTKGIASITPKLYTKNGKVELGYYAQDFVGVLDSAVSKGSDDMLSLSYREVHTAKIYALEQEIKELKAKLN
jgi:hypothetical protein